MEASPTKSPSPFVYIPSLIAAAAAVWFWQFLGPVSDGDVLRWSRPWVEGFSPSIELAFAIDGLRLTFALMVTGIGALIFFYTAQYFKSDPRLPRLLAMLSAFAIAMLALVLADDALTLFVAWEATTVTSFLLVGFDHEKQKARDAALQALLVTGLGGLALLAGLLLLGQQTGTLTISEWTTMGDEIRALPMYPVIFVLVALGAFTKSAQVPFHFWLPGAMAAPTPVSAYLHSATMVKAGVFLLALLTPAMGGTQLWIWTLTLFGAATMLWASFQALRQTDLKLMLAYTTVMGLGSLVMFLGGSSPYAFAAALTFLVVHALYKAALFLTVGLLDKGAGTRDSRELGGLARAMPITFAIAALAGLSMAGFPPFLGFIGKELKYEGALAVSSEPLLVASAAVLANALMVAAAGLVALAPFLGRKPNALSDAQDPNWGLILPPAILACLGLTFGVFPELLSKGFLAPMLDAIGVEQAIKLKLWHGINLPLMLSILTFALGIIFYLNRATIQRALTAQENARQFTASGVFDLLLNSTKTFARKLTNALQNGEITSYLRIAFATLAVLLWGALMVGDQSWPQNLSLAHPLGLLIAALVIGGALIVALTASRLFAITALGIVGAGVAGLFVLFSAIDVAITQILVEMLTVVFLATALVCLPRIERAPLNARDAIIAGALGLAVTAVLLGMVSTPVNTQIPTFFEQASMAQAFGQNIVNVILVDFRALDTLGEVAVVLVAAVAGAAAIGKSAKPGTEAVSSTILRTATAVLTPFFLALSLFVLWRGHNDPGGGFIGGLVAVIAFALYLKSHGPAASRALLRVEPLAMSAVGLAAAVIAGLWGLIAKGAFLKGVWPLLSINEAGEKIGLPIGSVLLFDLGVYLTVFGAVVALLLAFEERMQSERGASD